MQKFLATYKKPPPPHIKLLSKVSHTRVTPTTPPPSMATKLEIDLPPMYAYIKPILIYPPLNKPPLYAMCIVN